MDREQKKRRAVTRKTALRKTKLFIINMVFIVMCLIALSPIYYAFTVSTNADNRVLSSGLTLFPKNFTLENYVTVIKDKPFMLWLKNSLLLSVSTTVFSIGISIPAAYAFSRFKFAGRKTTLNILILLNAFPAVLSMFAIYRIMKLLNLMNSYAGLVIIYCGTMVVFSLWKMKG
jgi:arabinogalactan oligomer/maltooligosaccharide transport system permease protein